MISRDQVERFRNPYEAKENTAAISGLPPYYLVGFEPSISEGRLTIGSGTASVDGTSVSLGDTLITDSHWAVNKVGSFTYYIYVIKSGDFLVDIIAPTDANRVLSHPYRDGRYIMHIEVDTNLDISLAAKALPSELSAGDLSNATARDQLALQLGYTDYATMVTQVSTDGSIITSGGYLRADLIEADSIVASMIASGTITAEEMATSALQAMFAAIGYQITVGFDGTGTQASPDEGDRRAYIDEDELLLQEYSGGGWATVNGIKIGGAVAGIFLSMVGCRMVVNPEVTPTAAENEVFPGPGRLYDLENDFLDQNGEAIAADSNVVFTASPVKFGTYAATAYGEAANGALTGFADGTPGESQAISAWYYTGLMGTQNEEWVFDFGWDGASTTYGSYMKIEFGSAGVINLEWWDDYAGAGDNVTSFVTLSSETWYHIAFIWDPAPTISDEGLVRIIVNDTEYPITVDGFTAAGIRDSEPVRANFILDKDETTAIDDLAILKDYQINSDVFIQHYNHNLSWNASGITAKDLVLRAAEGGRVVVQLDDGDLDVTYTNANGSYRKFSDGTMIQWGSATESSYAMTSAAGGGYRGGDMSVTFPETFASAPTTYSSSTDYGAPAVFPSETSPTTTTGYFVGWRGNSSTTDIAFNWHAIGTWK